MLEKREQGERFTMSGREEGRKRWMTSSDQNERIVERELGGSVFRVFDSVRRAEDISRSDGQVVD